MLPPWIRWLKPAVFLARQQSCAPAQEMQRTSLAAKAARLLNPKDAYIRCLKILSLAYAYWRQETSLHLWSNQCRDADSGFWVQHNNAPPSAFSFGNIIQLPFINFCYSLYYASWYFRLPPMHKLLQEIEQIDSECKVWVAF